jgi:predicted AAA+ superfamily ATPase
MTDLLKEIILDEQSGGVFTGTLRRLKVSHVQNKAAVIIGVRRSGKSTFLNQIKNRLISEGMAAMNMLHINFFDDRLSTLKIIGLDVVVQAYFLLFPNKKGNEKVCFFFDEIQVIPGWEAFIDRLLRTENCMVYLSGSSQQMLSKEIGTQMRGRALSWELFPFSFQEFTDHLKINNKFPLNGQQRLLIENAFNEYWESGGFPEVIGMERALRIKIHQEYFNSILFRDLIERYDISHPRAMIDLARHLLENISSMYTLNSLTGLLKSLGHNVPKNSVSDYLHWFEDAYFLFTVRLFDASFRRSNANPKKMYCIDHAMVRSVSSGILVNSGHLLENMVFLALRRTSPEVFYYKTAGNLEVDFILKDLNGHIMLFQVCETIANTTTRTREINALQTAMAELGVETGTIVTRNETDFIQLQNGSIEVKPVWRFLLEISALNQL